MDGLLFFYLPGGYYPQMPFAARHLFLGVFSGLTLTSNDMIVHYRGDAGL